MTAYLLHALEYARRDWCIVPIRNTPGGDKQAAVKWARFQVARPSDAELHRWFGHGTNLRGVTGLAVVLGPVSGDLYCRDFDDAGAYWGWARACPDLATTLPTARTARGFHVYAKWPGARYMTLPDGELRAEGTHYVLLPPSLHPSGTVYEWVVPPPVGEPLPAIEPAAAMLISCETEQAEQTEYSEQTEQSEAIKGSLRACSAVLDFQRPRSLVTTETLARARPSIDDAIRFTLPSGEGRRNRAVFQLARALKAIPELADADVKGLRPIVREWHRRATPHVRTKDFVTTWADFVIGWGRVRLPMGESRMDKAIERARTNPPPRVAADYADNPHMVRLLSLCRELQREHAAQPFYLSCRMAERALGIDHGTANRYLRVLVADRVLRIHEKGERGLGSGKATRFVYIGGE